MWSASSFKLQAAVVTFPKAVLRNFCALGFAAKQPAKHSHRTKKHGTATALANAVILVFVCMLVSCDDPVAVCRTAFRAGDKLHFVTLLIICCHHYTTSAAKLQIFLELIALLRKTQSPTL